MKSTILMLAVVCTASTPGFAQERDLEAAHKELTEINRLEQEAFVSGDCEGLVGLMSEDITFYANGHVLARDGVKQMCTRIPRPFPGTGKEETQIRMVSVDAGYVIKFMTFPGTDRVEVITKVWRKGAEGWRMVHFQSTVTDPKQAK